ncbi:MAG: acetylxylan esterase [Phycisphaerales bacterium]
MPIDDFGLDPGATLAHVGDPTPPPGFTQFWSAWVARLSSVTPAMTAPTPDEEAACGAPGVTHLIRSTGGVRVGARLTEPTGTPSGVVITLHGYHVDPQDELRIGRGWVERGMAVLDLRVRGYPGSMLDVGDRTVHEGGYITFGLGDPWDWTVQGAVADVLCSVRALRARYGEATPVMLHGESFGGGLGVIAASVGRDIAPIARLAIGLPTFGDWRWRLQVRAGAGSGGEILRHLDAHPEESQRVRACLAMFDAVVHARRVQCPCIFKLAQRDEVVPAPSAAAIYNALGVGPGEKWRFLVGTGHAPMEEAGMEDVRRHAMFEKVTDAFLDPLESPIPLMKKLRPTFEGVIA